MSTDKATIERLLAEMEAAAARDWDLNLVQQRAGYLAQTLDLAADLVHEVASVGGGEKLVQLNGLLQVLRDQAQRLDDDIEDHFDDIGCTTAIKRVRQVVDYLDGGAS